MKKIKIAFWVCGVLAMITVSGCEFSFVKNDGPKKETNELHEVQNNEGGDAKNEKNESELDLDEISGEKPKVVVYSDQLYEELLGERPFALYFHADWCPVCFALEENIKKNLSSLPDGTLILQVDFDNSEELQKKYSIDRQATLVFLDSHGDWVGTESNPSISRISELVENSKN